MSYNFKAFTGEEKKQQKDEYASREDTITIGGQSTFDPSVEQDIRRFQQSERHREPSFYLDMEKFFDGDRNGNQQSTQEPRNLGETTMSEDQTPSSLNRAISYLRSRMKVLFDGQSRLQKQINDLSRELENFKENQRQRSALKSIEDLTVGVNDEVV